MIPLPSLMGGRSREHSRLSKASVENIMLLLKFRHVRHIKMIIWSSIKWKVLMYLAKKWPERVVKWPTHRFVCFFMHKTIDQQGRILEMNGGRFAIKCKKRKTVTIYWTNYFPSNFQGIISYKVLGCVFFTLFWLLLQYVPISDK